MRASREGWEPAGAGCTVPVCACVQGAWPRARQARMCVHIQTRVRTHARTPTHAHAHTHMHAHACTHARTPTPTFILALHRRHRRVLSAAGALLACADGRGPLEDSQLSQALPSGLQQGRPGRACIRAYACACVSACVRVCLAMCGHVDANLCSCRPTHSDLLLQTCYCLRLFPAQGQGDPRQRHRRRPSPHTAHSPCEPSLIAVFKFVSVCAAFISGQAKAKAHTHAPPALHASPNPWELAVSASLAVGSAPAAETKDATAWHSKPCAAPAPKPEERAGKAGDRKTLTVSWPALAPAS